MHSQFEDMARHIVDGVRDLLNDPKRQTVRPEWLAPIQAAAYIGTTVGTLTQWRSDRRGPKFTRRGNMVRYRHSDLDAFMEEAYVDLDR